jgi:hypothetical protein
MEVAGGYVKQNETEFRRRGITQKKTYNKYVYVFIVVSHFFAGELMTVTLVGEHCDCWPAGAHISLRTATIQSTNCPNI